MKKLRSIILLGALLFAVPALADNPVISYPVKGQNVPTMRPVEKMLQQQTKDGYQYHLQSYCSNDGHEINRYYYTGDKLLAAYSEVVGDFRLYDSVQYNAQGQAVRVAGWQWLNNQWKNVSYIDYTYNDRGLIATRTNYNNFGGEWNLGGVYEYTYNSQGQITLSEMTMAGDNYVFQRVEYTYKDGLLQQELWSIHSFSTGNMDPSESITYTYSNGLPQVIYDSIWDGSRWSYEGRQEFSYDGNNNCIRHSEYDITNRETNRSEFDFNNVALSATLMPYHPELVRPTTYNNTNNITTERWYTMDANDVFRHAWDYIYTYTEHLSIADVENNTTAIKLYPNPASSTIQVEAPQNAAYTIHDIQGRTLLSGTLQSSSIDISMLPNGQYFLRVAKGSAPFIINK